MDDHCTTSHATTRTGGRRWTSSTVAVVGAHLKARGMAMKRGTRHPRPLGYDHAACPLWTFQSMENNCPAGFRLPEANPHLMRRSVLAVSAVLGAFAGTMSPAAWADSTEAYCVLSKANTKAVPQQGSCRWSQRQGNVSITFQSRDYDFPADQEGKSYKRMNRDGAEAGPEFTRKGQYTLSVYWRKPAADWPGF